VLFIVKVIIFFLLLIWPFVAMFILSLHDALPILNGIEAARQIRKLLPESEIIFLTQESSAEVMQEAFSLGARGYIVKAKAGSELLTAVEAGLLGKTFVSSSNGNR